MFGGDAGLALKIIIGGALAIAGASVFPPLTAWEAPAATQARARDVPAHVLKDNGLQWCRQSLPGVDCACFARKAGEVLTDGRDRAAGWSYADTWDLARDQAAGSCS